MTPEQEKHLKEVKVVMTLLIDEKYRAGQKEHGGNLFDMPLNQLLDEALNEVVDMGVYIITARQKLKQFMEKYGDEGTIQPDRVGEGDVKTDTADLPKAPVRSVHDIPTNEKLY